MKKEDTYITKKREKPEKGWIYDVNTPKLKVVINRLGRIEDIMKAYGLDVDSLEFILSKVMPDMQPLCWLALQKKYGEENNNE